MLQLLKNKRVLVVVAHPDDEILGLGATMKRLISDENIITRVVILGEGITSRDNSRNVSKRKSDLSAHQNDISLLSTREAINKTSILAPIKSWWLP